MLCKQFYYLFILYNYLRRRTEISIRVTLFLYLNYIPWPGIKYVYQQKGGGLGLKHMKVLNSIALVKTVWRLLWNKDQLRLKFCLLNMETFVNLI